MHKLCVDFLAETFLQLNSSGLSLQVLMKSLKYYYTAHGGGPPLKLCRFHHHHHRPRKKGGKTENNVDKIIAESFSTS